MEAKIVEYLKIMQIEHIKPNISQLEKIQVTFNYDNLKNKDSNKCCDYENNKNGNLRQKT